MDIPPINPQTPEGQIVINALGQIAASGATQVFRQAFSLLRGEVPPKRTHARMSDKEFAAVRNLLREQRTLLARVAYYLPAYADLRALEHASPLLVSARDRQSRPLPIALPGSAAPTVAPTLRTRLVSHVGSASGGNDVVARTTAFLPCDEDGSPWDYVQAIRSIEDPPEKYFHDLPSYRFLRTEDDAEGRVLEFAKSQYFDYQRTCEVLCLEFAWCLHQVLAESPSLANPASVTALHRALIPKLNARGAAPPGGDNENRHSIGGLNVLLVLHDAVGDHRFLMMHRSPRLASAMGTYHVIPAGEFQPSATTPDIVRDECNLWYTFVREFAEELLLHPRAETHSARAYSFEAEQPFAAILREARNGNLKLWYLGHGYDPLSLKTEILGAAVIRRDAFRRVLFQAQVPPADGRLVHAENTEGQIISGRDGSGLILNAENVMTYRDDEHTLPAGSASLHLAWEAREQLLQME